MLDNEVIKKHDSRLEDDSESDNFPLCCYRTVAQAGTVLRWFCIITCTACAFSEQKYSCLRTRSDCYLPPLLISFLPTRRTLARKGVNVYCPECPPGGTIGHPGGQQKKFLPFGHGRNLVAFNGTGL